jgi:hypothetical protein
MVNKKVNVKVFSFGCQGSQGWKRVSQAGMKPPEDKQQDGNSHDVWEGPGKDLSTSTKVRLRTCFCSW